VRRENTGRIMSSYHEKMEELGTCEARDAWCLQVEQQLGCSTEHGEDDAPPGLLRVRKLENDILNLVSLRSTLLFATDRCDYLFRLYQQCFLRSMSSLVLFPRTHATLLHVQQAVSLSMTSLYLMFSMRRVWTFKCYLITWNLEFGIFLLS
jgi:hypothetical protein